MGPPPEEVIAGAESAKEAGNALLKTGDFAGAIAKYKEGIDQVEPLLSKAPPDISEDLCPRRTAVYVAVCLNSALACLKSEDWMSAAEHANKVLVIDKDNAKALFRRGSACSHFDTESRLEQARADFSRVAQVEPSNREV